MITKGSIEEHYPHRNEEKLNGISHGIGVLLAIVGMFVLLSHNSGKTAFATSSILVYSFTLIAMFVVSSTYHATKNFKIKRTLRILDHINIYFLIAGTYTPVALITLEKESGWLIIFVVWGIAVFGTVFKIFYTGKLEFLSLLLYVAMGWLIVLDFDNLVEHTSFWGIRLLFLGGAFYTLGIIFYALERFPFNHFIWHLFVLGGAISHWFFIYSDVV